MPTLHIVPHTHWDREWYLPFQPMRIKLVHLVDRLLDLLAEEPAYRHFTLDGQTIVVEDYLRIRPEQRGQIVGHVATGRILIGPWTVLPDEFLVSPESIVRNLQRGRRVAEDLGGCMNVGYVPDPFGHIGQLPQILRGFGIEDAAFRRGLSDEPCELTWEAPDGSRVAVAYLRDGYDNAARLPTDPEAFRATVCRRGERLAPHSAVSHRLLMNGTDHHEPQRELGALVEGPRPAGTDWLISTLPRYFAAVRSELEESGEELPVVQGELRSPKRHHLLPGVLSSRIWIKLRNDTCERLLERWAEPFVAWAERFCADQADVAVWTGQVATPRVREAGALLDEAWRILLTCHPHDSICGCSIDQVHEEMRTRFDQVEQIGEEVVRQSLAALAEAVDTTSFAEHGARRSVVVFNPATTVRTELSRFSVELGAGLEPFELVCDDGTVLPHRVLGREARDLARLDFAPDDIQPLIRGVSDGRVAGMSVQEVAVRRDGSEAHVELVLSESGDPDMDEVRRGIAALEAELPAVSRVRLHTRFATRVEVEAWVPGLPPHGYRSLGLRPPRSEPAPVQSGGRFAIEAAADGTLNLTDSVTGLRLDGLLRLRDEAECGDSYNFCPLDGDEPITKAGAPARISTEPGPGGDVLVIEQTLRVPARLAPDRRGRSEELLDLPIRMWVSAPPGVPRVDVRIDVWNRSEDHRLQVLFPVGGPVREAAFDGHFEIVHRPTLIDEAEPGWQEQPTSEQPMRAFVAARPHGDAEGPGLLVANHGLREASVSPDGVIAITLLRCFGWLSRDDLSTREEGAGPTIPVPGGQCAGHHSFRLSLIPFRGDLTEAVQSADAFQTPPRGIGCAVSPGALLPVASLLSVEPNEFRLTAVVPERDGSVVVRGVYGGVAPGPVRLEPRARPVAASRVRLDGAPLESLTVDSRGWVELPARPNEIVSVRLTYASP
ncbi:MAG: hypothetical protein V3T14_02140 [Myxococcota bacterium]